MTHTKKSSALVFEVERNNIRLCTAGLQGKNGSVSVILSHLDYDGEGKSVCNLSVGAFVSDTAEFLRWVDVPVTPGDCLQIQIKHGGKLTPKVIRESAHSALPVETLVANLRKTAKSFGYRLVKMPGKHADRD